MLPPCLLQAFMPVMSGLLSVHVTTGQFPLILAMLDNFKECCRNKADVRRPNNLGQNMLRNVGEFMCVCCLPGSAAKRLVLLLLMLPAV